MGIIRGINGLVQWLILSPDKFYYDSQQKTRHWS